MIRLSMRRSAGEKAITGASSARTSPALSTSRLSTTPAAFCDRILDKTGDQPAHNFVNETRRLKAGVKHVDLAADLAQKIDLANIGDRNQPGAQTVVDIVGVIGDVVGQRRRLRFGAGEAGEVEIGNRAKFQKRGGQPARGVAGDGSAILLQQRPIMLDKTFQGLDRKIEAVEGGITALKLGDDAKRLRIVVEAAIRPHQGVKRVLASMAERRMPEIMRERERFGEIVIEAESARQSARDLADFERMSQPGAVMIALIRYEDLRLMGERAGMPTNE